ncbi:MAG: hypothetical protein PUC37_01350 [Spirochaetales bacterium]|nr:hypothetical protein [Spirochaetales bacterium]
MKKSIIVSLFILISPFLFANDIKTYIPFKESPYVNKAKIKASSYLTENKISYDVSNLSPKVNLPWIPDFHDNGKNAYLIINNCEVNEIFISIGYVDTNRPDLYYKNSRPKKIRIYFEKTKKEKEYLLEDTSNAQKIILSENPGAVGTIIITFSEVYEGTKYKDLCINFLAKKEIIEDSKLYDAIKNINEYFKTNKKYLYILSDKDSYYPGKPFYGCPVESEYVFKHEYKHDCIEAFGDGYCIKKDFLQNTLIPLFENEGIHFESIEYLYEITENNIVYSDLGFSINNVKYRITAWMFDKDFFILDLILLEN